MKRAHENDVVGLRIAYAGFVRKVAIKARRVLL